jgi:hypothetical protein
VTASPFGLPDPVDGLQFEVEWVLDDALAALPFLSTAELGALQWTLAAAWERALRELEGRLRAGVQ